MNSILLKKHKFDIPIISEIDCMLDKCFKGCHNNYFQKFLCECTYDNKLTNTTNVEVVSLTISGKSMNLYDLIKNLAFDRQNGFVFNQRIELTIKFSSHSRFINLRYYLRFQIPMCDGKFFRVISQNREKVQNFCNELENRFNSACQKRVNQLN